MTISCRRRRRLLLAYCIGASLVFVCTHGFVIVGLREATPAARLFDRRLDGRWMAAQPLFSLTQEQKHEPSSSSIIPLSSSSIFKDVFMLCGYFVSCMLVAIAVSMYQDFDVSHTKPQGPLRERAILGMAYSNDESIYPAYNTVMQHHRDYRVPMWKQTENAMSHDDAVRGIIQALQAIDQLKQMATNYEWDEMQSLLRDPILSSQLEQACSVLRKTATSPEARDEIGFDWGSCAWRHCGAQADAQESLAELYNLIGVLEPFECLFCLDIVERSLHDILAVSNVLTEMDIPAYKPYQARGQEDGDSALDMDFLQALNGLKSQLF